MKSEIFTICDYAADNSGKLTIVGTFTRYEVSALPNTILSFAVVLRVRYEQGEEIIPQYQLTITDSEGKNILDAPINVNTNVPDTPERLSNVVVNISGMPLEQYGRYDVRLSASGAEYSTYFTVVQKGEQPR